MNEIIIKDCKSILEKINLNLFKNKRILITGSNGLLGRYLAVVFYLANQNHNANIYVKCISKSKNPCNEIDYILNKKNHKLLKYKSLDLSNKFEINEAFDYIFHAACYGQTSKWMKSKLTTIRLNIDATRYLLENAKKNSSRFLFFSTLDVYGNMPEDIIPVKETYSGNLPTDNTRSTYGESKRMAETLAYLYRKESNLKTYAARIFHSYGPGISIYDERVIGNFIKMALIDKKINLLDMGETTKYFSYVNDTIYMLIKIISEGKDFAYNVCGNTKLSIFQLAKLVSKFCGNVPVVLPSKIVELEHVKDSSKHVGASIEKFEKEFGKVYFLNFEEGVKRIIEWNKKEFNI